MKPVVKVAHLEPSRCEFSGRFESERGSDSPSRSYGGQGMLVRGKATLAARLFGTEAGEDAAGEQAGAIEW